MRPPGRTEWLWTPWRMTYIKQVIRERPPSGCFLCSFVRLKSDRKNLVLLRGRSCFVVMNKYPYTSGHLLIAPMRHKGAPKALTAEERSELFELLIRSQEAIDRSLHPHGYNVGFNLGRVAGAGLPGHLHLHVVPRWNGDANFMTAVGQTKVIPATLDGLYGRLQKALRDGR